MREDMKEFMDAGADAFISKPITPRNLKQAVEKSFTDALDRIF